MPAIHGSSISKCFHGVYLASAQEVRADKATYCGICTPEGPFPSQEWKDAVAAITLLKRNFDKASCPKCGSETRHTSKASTGFAVSAANYLRLNKRIPPQCSASLDQDWYEPHHLVQAPRMP